MTESKRLLFHPDAAATLRKVRDDATRTTLWTALKDALNAIAERPGSSDARRGEARVRDVAIWQVPVRAHGERWRVSWFERDEETNMILYAVPE